MSKKYKVTFVSNDNKRTKITDTPLTIAEIMMIVTEVRFRPNSTMSIDDKRTLIEPSKLIAIIHDGIKYNPRTGSIIK